MKLSEAIRLGAMMKPQGFGALRVIVDYPNRRIAPITSVRTCAWGAAYDAVGVLERAVETYDFLDEWTMDQGQGWGWAVKSGTAPQCPVTGITYPNVSEIIVGLNDEHRWTREQIADWVATVEPQDVQIEADSTQDSTQEPAEIVL